MLYLNNAATSYPKPQNTNKAISKFIEELPLSSNRSAIHGTDYLDLARKKLSIFLNADDKNKISFSSGATESLNLIIRGLDLKNSKVLTTVTEHNSVLRPLNHLIKNGLLENIDFVECDRNGKIDLKDFENKIDKNTKLIIASHSSNVTGLNINIAELCEIAKKNNVLTLIDCAQSIGASYIDLKEIKPDFLVFTSHKSLLGLSGNGGAYIDDPTLISPLKSGGSGYNSVYPYQVEEAPAKFEAGTQNLIGACALSASLDFISRVGLKTIIEKKYELVQGTIDGLKKIDKVRILGDADNIERTGIVSFIIDGIEPTEAAQMLGESFDIVLRAGLHCAPLIFKHLGAEQGSIRASFSYFNTNDDTDALLEAVKEISKSL